MWLFYILMFLQNYWYYTILRVDIILSVGLCLSKSTRTVSMDSTKTGSYSSDL